MSYTKFLLKSIHAGFLQTPLSIHIFLTQLVSGNFNLPHIVYIQIPQLVPLGPQPLKSLT